MKKVLLILLSLFLLSGICYAQDDRWVFITKFYIEDVYGGEKYLDKDTIKKDTEGIKAWIKDVHSDDYINFMYKIADDYSRKNNTHASIDVKRVEYSYVLFDLKQRKYKILNLPEIAKNNPQYNGWYEIEPDSIMEREINMVKKVSIEKGIINDSDCR